MKRRHLFSGLVSLFVILPFLNGRAEKNKVLIVALGDSTTAGTPFFRSALEVPPEGEGDPQGQYAYWMMRKRPQWNVLNYGIAGQTSSQIRGRLGDALKLKPRYIIILAGVNDIYQGAPVDEVADNLLSMYQQTQGMNIMPIAATILPFDKATPAQVKAIEKLNQWILKAADRLNIPVADLNKATRDPKFPTHLNGSPDGLHPDMGGYRKMGLALTDAIDPIEKAWR